MVIVIAEAGVNHNGSLELAKKLIDKAKLAGADFIKFQTFITELNISTEARKADYQKQSTGSAETQFEMVKKLELSFNDFSELKFYCEKVGIEFLSTGFDRPSIDFLDSLKPTFHKIPSGEITNKPLLQHIARKGKDIILSTGMANLLEVKAALNVLYQEGIKKSQVTVLHCNTEYPTPMEDVNLLAMKQMARDLKVKVGYSDHTFGIEVPIAAVALGAHVIEKHFTLNRNLPGPDHAASLEPEELKSMVKAIRNIEKAISGNGIKEASESEKKNLSIVRKSLHYKKSFEKGHLITVNDFIVLRPATGINPMQIDNFVGRKLKIDVTEGHASNNEDFI